MNALVSIITPCYNGESYISLAIESVIAQTYQNWEMIIVDDCSKDNSAAIIKDYQKRDIRIRYYKTEQPSGSPSLPRNIAINEAQGQYITFLDSDDIWLPNKLADQLNVIGNPEVAIVFSNYEKMGVGGERAERVVDAPSTVDYSLLLKGNCIGCLTAMYDTSKIGKMFFKKIGHEDYALWLSILRKGYKAQNTNTLAALYRVGNTSVSSNKLKVLSWQWNILRNEEHLPVYKAVYCYLNYAFRALSKAVK